MKPVLFDFDGDGAADLSFFGNPQDGTFGLNAALQDAACAGALVLAASADAAGETGLIGAPDMTIAGPNGPMHANAVGIKFTIFLEDGTPVRAAVQTQVSKDAFYVDFAWDGIPNGAQIAAPLDIEHGNTWANPLANREVDGVDHLSASFVQGVDPNDCEDYRSPGKSDVLIFTTDVRVEDASVSIKVAQPGAGHDAVDQTRALHEYGTLLDVRLANAQFDPGGAQATDASASGYTAFPDLDASATVSVVSGDSASEVEEAIDVIVFDLG
ncbi:MAG: hypothetical protein AAFP68_03525 [Pseudomonadota bacterium]